VTVALGKQALFGDKQARETKGGHGEPSRKTV
jgi:hypothetical protein